MFKVDKINRAYLHDRVDWITVRANKNGKLQYMVVKVDDKTGGWKIKNEGYVNNGEVIGFKVTH